LLVAELLDPDGEDQIAWRNGERLVARLTRADVAVAKPLQLDSESTYLIVGGLGGLGRPLTRRLVERGARHVVIASRHASDTAEKVFKSELAALGAEVRIVSADVSNGRDVERVFSEIAATPWPLRGVVHAAGVLDDGVVRALTWDRMVRVLAPKVTGAWNLHLQTQKMELDFFVLFSSATALLGSSGQANHAAANAFLDSLAQYRRARGLSALSIGWGAWEEIGAAAERGVSDRFRSKGIGSLTPAEGWENLERLMGSSAAYVAVIPIDWSNVDSELTASPFFRGLRIEPAASLGENKPSQTGETLAMMPQAERQAWLLGEIRRQVAHVLGVASAGQIDPQQGFFTLGMDSLTSVELRNRLQATLVRPLPSTVAFDYPTSQALAAHLASGGGPLERLETEAKPPLASGIGVARLDGLSVDELSALIDLELRKP
jgi:NAD(P)-dependent dehydrogenase (short-subunit alcohol dehydrogenase family)/acyl carrier protein